MTHHMNSTTIDAATAHLVREALACGDTIEARRLAYASEATIVATIEARFGSFVAFVTLWTNSVV